MIQEVNKLGHHATNLILDADVARDLSCADRNPQSAQCRTAKLDGLTDLASRGQASCPRPVLASHSLMPNVLPSSVLLAVLLILP